MDQNRGSLTMKFKGTFRAMKFDLDGYRRAVDKHLRETIAMALMEWLEATVLAEIPVWSGASRATFLAVARHIQYSIPIFSVAPVNRVGQGMAESVGELETDSAKGRYVFKYSTTLPWLIVNEYFDATQWGFNLKKPGPYNFQLKGQLAFESFAANVRLPNPLPYIKPIPIKVG
jgi:hypothetical protein